MSTQAALHQPSHPGPPPSPEVLVDVVVLSADAVLFEAIRNAIGERNPLWHAHSAEESVDLLLTGRCGVLVIDMSALSTDPTTFIEQIVAQFPDIVAVVAGRSNDESLLARLISDGLVYRFMHKPLSAKRAGMFLGASIRHHVERRERRVPESLLPRAGRLPSRIAPRTLTFIATGLGLLVVLLAVQLGRLGRDEPREPTAARSPPIATATRAATPQADPVLSRARAALASGRYESPAGRNALDLYAAVLLANPGHAEARAGLEDTVERIVAMADRAAAKGRTAEARRLLERAHAAELGNGAVAALALRLEPPASPIRKPSKSSFATPPPRTVAVTPPTPALRPAAALNPVVVAVDPLTPRIVNADELRRRPALSVGRPSPYSAFGSPAPSGHAIAGYVEQEPVVAVPPLPVETLARGGSGAGTEPLPIEEFQPLAVTEPSYPLRALRDGIEGWVELEFTISEAGVVRDVEVIEAEPRGVFEGAAADALGTWRFKPRLVNGRPVAERSVVTLRFNVDD